MKSWFEQFKTLSTFCLAIHNPLAFVLNISAHLSCVLLLGYLLKDTKNLFVSEPVQTSSNPSSTQAYPPEEWNSSEAARMKNMVLDGFLAKLNGLSLILQQVN